MYFSEQELLPPQEIYSQSLEYLQTAFTAEHSAFQLPHIFEIINMAHRSDESLASYALDFHPNSRLIASLQAQTYGRPAVAKILAESVESEDTFFSDTMLGQARNGLQAPYSHQRAFNHHVFDLSPPIRPNQVTYPCDMDAASWQALAKSTPGAIVATIQQHHEDKGSRPESDILQTAIRLVCAKKTRGANVLVATAPTRIATAYRVLQQSGVFYGKGVTAISGALERSNYDEEWDQWRLLALRGQDNIAACHKLTPESWQMLYNNGVSLAIRNKRPSVALNIISDAMRPYIHIAPESKSGATRVYDPPTQEPSHIMINALATLVRENQYAADASTP